MKVSTIIIILSIIAVFIIAIVIGINYVKIDFLNGNQTNNTKVQNSLNNTNQSEIDINNTFNLPANDYVINSINWSDYPNLQVGYVYFAQVCEPNDIVPHKFIGVEILTEVKDTKNITIIKGQLASVAKETRKIYGPNSAISILGTDHGVLAWTVTMRVYDDKVYY